MIITLNLLVFKPISPVIGFCVQVSGVSKKKTEVRGQRTENKDGSATSKNYFLPSAPYHLTSAF
jgi:hypothetical protein